MPDEETQYQLLKILSEQPGVSQRQLAVTLGFSLGKVNYCLRIKIGLERKIIIKITINNLTLIC